MPIMNYMKCYLCKSPMRLFMIKNGFAIHECTSCGLRQTDLKRPYSEFVTEYYTKGYFSGDRHFNAYSGYLTDKPFIVKNMRKFLARILKHKKKGKLLDVGCATGFFVELALQHGFDAYGIDPSKFAVIEARKLVGNRIQLGTITTAKYKPNSFDVITLFDVFEHLHDPKKDIRKLMGLLKSDGIMVIATGNTECLMAKAMGRRWTFYNPPQHLFFFNKTLMKRFLSGLHLRPIDWFTIGKWLNLKYVFHLARTVGESKIGDIAYTLFEKIGLVHVPVYLPVQDNMVVIVRKEL